MSRWISYEFFMRYEGTLGRSRVQFYSKRDIPEEELKAIVLQTFNKHKEELTFDMYDELSIDSRRLREIITDEYDFLFKHTDVEYRDFTLLEVPK